MAYAVVGRDGVADAPGDADSFMPFDLTPIRSGLVITPDRSNVAHEKGFRALCMRPLALSPMFSIDLKVLKDMAHRPDRMATRPLPRPPRVPLPAPGAHRPITSDCR